MLVAQHGRRQKMYYRIAIQQGRDQLDRPSTWQWKSTALSSLQSLFQVLRLYGALPQEHLRVFSSLSREGLEEQFRQENRGLGSSSVTAEQFLHERLLCSPEVARGTAEHEGVVDQQMAAIAARSQPSVNESSRAAHALSERSMSSLEKRRVELERGA